MSREATPALGAVGRRASRLADAPLSLEERVEADRAVFAKAASIRKLSLTPIPAFDCKSESNQELTAALGSSSTPATARSSFSHTAKAQESPVSGPLRRPSTAVSAHIRVHQALRRSESEFVFTSKDATVDGFLYSSRFDHLHSTSGTSGSARRNRSALSSPLDPSIRQKLAKVGKSARTAAATGRTASDGSDPAASAGAGVSGTADGLDNQMLQYRRRRAISAEISPPGRVGLLTIDASASKPSRQYDHVAEERAYLHRKRRCAKTFEEMIFARLSEASASTSLEESIAALLSHGIIPSVLELSAIADATTQAHCCRALYYLSQVPSARKPMVAHGVVGAIKALSRITAARPRQDLAATLCHLSEENGLVEVLLFEGIDQSLARLFAVPSAETKRICALTVFNISVDALTIKHFGDAFAQLLVLATRASSHAAASNLIKAAYNASLAPAFHVALLSENIPRFLLQQLPHVPAPIQTLALRALVALCDSKMNRAQILSQGFCKLLEAMLASTNEDIQETTLTILLLLSIDEGSRIKLCNWVPAAAIVQSASQHVENCSAGASARSHSAASAGAGDRLVYLASCVLRNLCDSVLTHHELIEEDVVRVLLEMSRMGDSDIKANAICALCCIIASSTEESASYVLEITTELLALTRSDVPKTVDFAVAALYNITCSDDCLPLLAESPALLHRMLELAGPQTPLGIRERVAELVAAILYRLASIDAYQAKMLQHGVFPVLVHLIHSFPSGRTYAVNALYLLAQDGGEHFPHGGDEVAKLALALSEDEKSSLTRTSSNGSSSTTPGAAASTVTTRRLSAEETVVTTLRSAVTLLAHLARHPTNQSALVRSGAVFRFLRRLKRLEDEETILINCAYVYVCLTATQDGCEQLVREQGIEDVISLSRTSKLATASNQIVKELCMLALCRFSSFIGLEVRLIEHGAIDAVMIMALVATDSPRIKALCIKTLVNCLVAKNCVRPLIDHGVIWALASLCVVDSVETRTACAVSLCNLSAVPNMLSRFLDAGAPRALIHLLKQTDRATVMTTIKAIANLVASEKLCAVFLNEELEKHLSAHFSDPASSEELRQLAAMVLLRVTSANDAMISPERLRHGVFVWMEQIIIMKEADLVRNCMLTVHDLTCNTTIDVAELDVDHILRIVVQVLQRHQQNDEVVTLCLTVVYNLSCQRAVLARLVVPDIMLFLRQHVPIAPCEASLQLQHQSSKGALQTADPDAVVSSTATDVKLCCLVLHNMSCHIAPDVELLASLVTFDAVAILSDIYFARDDLKEICALATCNIVVGRVNSSRVLEGGAGALLLHFILNSTYFRVNHYTLASAALRRLVNAPGNQQLLLDAGITRAIVFMLGLPDLNDAPTLNLLATLSLLSKCSPHLTQLLDDGVLPSVIRIAEAKAQSPEALVLCFDILSNVCAVNFEAHVRDHPDINVISTLTKLSEHHHHPHYSGGSETDSHTPQHVALLRSVVTPSGAGTHASRTPSSPLSSKTSGSYLDRGEGKALGVPQLLTFLLKSPSNASSLKKNLELHATYTVPARKWVPDAHATPKDPPPLVCDEIALTETSQSIPSDVKQRIRNLLPLPKDALVRDESADDRSSASPNASTRPTSASGDSGSSNTTADTSPLLPTAFRALGSSGTAAGSKKLQRGLAGRNLSHSRPSASRASLLF